MSAMPAMWMAWKLLYWYKKPEQYKKGIRVNTTFSLRKIKSETPERKS